MDVDRDRVKEGANKVRIGKKTTEVVDFKWYPVKVERTRGGFNVSLPESGIEVNRKKAEWAGVQVLTAVLLARYKELTGKDYTYERHDRDQRRVCAQYFCNGMLIFLDGVQVHHVFDDGSMYLYGPVLHELASLGGERCFYVPDSEMTF